MRLFHSKTISLKITLIYTVLFSVILLLFSASILIGVKYYLFLQADKQIMDMKNIIVNKINQETVVDFNDKTLLDDLPKSGNMDVRIFVNQNIVNESSSTNYEVSEKLTSNHILYLDESNQHIKYLNINLSSTQENVTLQVVKNLDFEIDFLHILFLIIAFADVVGIVASAFLGLIVSKRMLTPIDDITKAANNISINNLKERIQLNGPDDELSRLSKTFNDMIDRLQDSFNKQNQFVSDASHELRTPLAVISGYANLIDRWGKDDKEALNKAIKAIKFESVNMTSLVNQLLFLAKGDSNHLQLDMKEFWLNGLIFEVVEETLLIHETKQIKIDNNEEIRLFADYNMIKQMMRIFIDNSVKFTDEAGQIYIKCLKIDRHIEITVTDNGIGIPESEIPHIFDRFYCVEESRSKTASGSGLGLSIAKSIIDLHNGEIMVTSKEGKGTTITVTFPIN